MKLREVCVEYMVKKGLRIFRAGVIKSRLPWPVLFRTDRFRVFWKYIFRVFYLWYDFWEKYSPLRYSPPIYWIPAVPNWHCQSLFKKNLTFARWINSPWGSLVSFLSRTETLGKRYKKPCIRKCGNKHNQRRQIFYNWPRYLTRDDSGSSASPRLPVSQPSNRRRICDEAKLFRGNCRIFKAQCKHFNCELMDLSLISHLFGRIGFAECLPDHM